MITYRGDLKKLAASQNIAEMLGDQDVAHVGISCQQGYIDDKLSRTQWEAWYAEALKLALQVREDKSFPWPNASNIKFPLLTIAALNFHAKAYPSIVNGETVVKCRSLGKDPDGEKIARAERVGRHMSYQLLETSPWEEQTDKMLLVMAILGTAFKKTVRDNNTRTNVSDLVIPQDLIVNYYTTDLETATRVSHRFTLTKNELRENINAGLYREPPKGGGWTEPPIGPLEAAKDKAQKLMRPPNTDKGVHRIVEQSCFWDLDGDGYEEPYAVTFDEDSGFVYRIIARFYPSDVQYAKDKKTVLRITAENYYTKFGLIPSPDGGFYDMGLGLLLGPLAESCSTLINQITDWATMNILAGGFLGRGVRMKAGDNTFKPLEWKTVDSTGDDLNKNIVPLPVREISPVILELLKFLVDYGERIAGSGDIQVGELPGQNVKAGTMEIANENGRLIFNSIFKRIWRSLKQEFKKFYRLNQYFQDDDEFTFGEKVFEIKKTDYQAYSDTGIVPAADPNIVSTSERRQVADMVMQTAMQVPGHNVYEAVKRRYEAYNVPGIDTLYPDPKGPNAIQSGPSEKQQELQLKAQQMQQKTLEMQQNHQLAVAKMLQDIQESNARIVKLTADAMFAMKQAEGIEKGHQIALLDALIGAEKTRRDGLLQTVGLLMDSFKDSRDAAKQGSVPTVAPAAGNAGVPGLPVAVPPDGNGGLGQAAALGQ